jgi:uncharacterized protein (TIGR00369 family)
MFERVRESFARQGIMGLLGARMTEVGEGRCVVEVPYSDGLGQQQRYFHGAVAGAIADSAGGYAALTLAPEGREVLTVEYKINFLAPARGEKLVARGRYCTPVAGCSSAGPRCSPSPPREKRRHAPCSNRP